MFGDLSGGLAAERHRDRLVRAEGYRMAADARAMRRNGEAGGPVVVRRSLLALRQTSGVRLRPIRTDDDVVLSQIFDGLSAESRRMRFLAPKHRLSEKELRYLVDVDHRKHEALVALSRRDGAGLGVGRFIRYGDEPDTADVALAVADEWQSRGLGTHLAMRLIGRARSAGIRRFTALVLAENVRAQALMRRVPVRVRLLERHEDQLTYELELPPAMVRL